jgi:alpha-amylase/alpha-mannosidase (GH57 family)
LVIGRSSLVIAFTVAGHSPMPIHLVMHGHFYQPPRENPWTGTIERQVSAAPFPDWNARIADECYLPNARSRVLDEQGRIQDIVNNYDRLSFNFGPTLLAWLAQAAPEGLAALVRADRESRARLGHGNAIGQAYNHMILPLATRRDRWTQIRWGIRVFEHHFGRRPEALWLPETAVDPLSLEILIQAGMQYVILSPLQAARWRPLGSTTWETCAEAVLDTRRPYRWLCRDAVGRPQGDRGIDVCFYHAPLSRGISFQHYLRDAPLLADRIVEAAAGGGGDPLLLVATDGESYGHHERFGDMCLANLFAREAPRRDIRPTNPAAYLAAHRPAWEVELQPMSAWSCSHGVGRWSEDCGCSTGGGPGWNQAWRRPLRQGLDRLRDALAPIFAEEAAPLLADPWAARDEYIDLLLDRTPAAREAFLARHRARPLSSDEQAKALRLLEMQHQAQLMYTSCAWFFADLSGIETLQNLRYACRAIELAAPDAARDLEAVLLEELARAQSNVPEHRDGRHLWARQVRPSAVLPEAAVARLLLEGLLGREITPQTRYRWALRPDPILRAGPLALAGVAATSEVTGEVRRFAAACRLDDPFDFLAGIAPWPGPEAWPGFADEACRALTAPSADLATWAGRHGARILRLRDLLPDERQALLGELLAGERQALDRAAAAIAGRAEPAALSLRDAGMPLPPLVRAALETHWGRLFADELEALGGVAHPAAYAALLDLGDRARHLGLTLDLAPASARFGRTLVARLAAIRVGGTVADWQEFENLLQVGIRLGLALPEPALQDGLFPLLGDRVPTLIDRLQDARDEPYPEIAAILAVSARLNLRVEHLRQRLRPLEASLATDPTYWP